MGPAGAAIVGGVGAATEAGLQASASGDSGARVVAKAVVAGAIGAAGGAAARAALLGGKGAKATSAAVKAGTATPAQKGIVAITDTVSDAVGQPALGAAVAATSGGDPVSAAVGSEVAAGLGTLETAHSIATDAPPASTGRTGAVRAVGAGARQIASGAARTIAKSQAGSAAAGQIIDEDRK